MIDDSELAELHSAVLTGVTVGLGSQVLIFGNGASLLVQCPFSCDVEGVERRGHGEEVATSVLFFDFLNSKVEHVSFDVQGVLLLDFGGVGVLTIVPELNGFESYVLNTKLGISPVSVI